MSSRGTPSTPQAEPRSADRAIRGRVGSVGWAAGAAAGAAAVLACTGHELSSVVLTVIAFACALAGQRSVLAGLPAAFLLTFVVTVVAWLGAAAAGTDVMATELASRGLLLALAGGAAVTALARRRRLAAARFTTRPEGVAALPAALLAAYGGLTALLPLPRGTSWFFLGSDNISHLLYVAGVQHAGSLDYGSDAYPRGWHALVATLLSASGAPTRGAAGLVQLIAVTSRATWALYVLFTLAMALCAVAVARHCGLTDRAASVAGTATGVTLLGGAFFTSTMALGFQTTILLAAWLAVAALETVTAGSRLRAFVVSSAVLLAVAHTWQMATPVAAVPWALCLAHLWSGRGWRVRDRVAAGVGCAVTALVAAPSMWAVTTQFGLQHAARWGAIEPAPLGWLLLGLGGAAWAIRRGGARGAAAVVAAMAVTSLLTGALVAAAVHASLTDYYPTKMFWHACVLSVPLAWIGAVRLWMTLGARASASMRLTRMTARVGLVTLVGGFTVLCLVTPLSAALSSWSSADGSRIIAAVTQPEAPEAQLTWRVAATPVGDQLSRMLLDFYATGTRRERTVAKLQSLQESCDVLRSSPRPAVLSSAPAAEVAAHFSCVPNVRAIPARR